MTLMVQSKPDHLKSRGSGPDCIDGFTLTNYAMLKLYVPD